MGLFPRTTHKHPKICVQCWEFTDPCSPCINAVARALLVDIFSMFLTSYPRLELLVATYPTADETQCSPSVHRGYLVYPLRIFGAQLAFQKWELLLITNVWLRQSETVLSTCSMGNKSEGNKPNANGLHESVKGYVGISGEGRGRRGHT